MAVFYVGTALAANAVSTQRAGVGRRAIGLLPSHAPFGSRFGRYLATFLQEPFEGLERGFVIRHRRIRLT